MADTTNETLDQTPPLTDTTTPSEISRTQTIRLPEVAPSPQEEEAPPGDAPSFHDVHTVLTQWLRSKVMALSQALHTRKALAVFVAAAGIVALAAVAASFIDAARVPSHEVVEAYVREHLADPPHATCSYIADEPLTVQEVEVTDARGSTTRRDACDVCVAVVYGNDALEARTEEQLTYVRSGETWNCTAATTGKTSYQALQGVDGQLVLEQLDALLEAADGGNEGTLSLASLYHGATAEIVDEQFDADEQTDQLSLRCTSTQGFVSYTCGLTAVFRFVPASGAWELAEVTASEGAKEPSLSPLEGTWYGTFVGQQADAASCLAAHTEGLVVSIDEVAGTGDDTTIAGTVTGVVHAHGMLLQEQNTTTGDRVLDGAAFTGTLTSSEAGSLVFTCTVPDETETQTTLSLTFGLPDDAEAAQATLTSRYDYRETLLVISWDRTAHFADTFTLERVEG